MFIVRPVAGVAIVHVGGQVSAGYTYDYVTLAQPPRIESLSPSSGNTTGNSTVCLSGTRFQSNGAVYFVKVSTGSRSECIWKNVPGMFYSDSRIWCVSALCMCFYMCASEVVLPLCTCDMCAAAVCRRRAKAPTTHCL